MSIQAGKAQGKLLRKPKRLLSHLFLYGGLGPLIGLIGNVIISIIIAIIISIINATPPFSYGSYDLRHDLEIGLIFLFASYFFGLPPALMTGIIASCLRKGRWLSFFLIILSGWLATAAYAAYYTKLPYLLFSGSFHPRADLFDIIVVTFGSGLTGAFAALVCSLLYGDLKKSEPE